MKDFTQAFRKRAGLAMEGDATDVKAGRETEIVIYARITDFSGLKKAASKHSQEQWQVNAPYGKIRVRNEAQDGIDGKYTMAIKSKDSVLGGSETEMGIDQSVFSAFKTIAEIGMIKDRYCFPVQRVMMRDQSGQHNVALPDLMFEVDVFKKPDGSYHEWCKIDLEIDAILNAVEGLNTGITTADLNINIGDLPFKPMEMMENTSKDQMIRDKITELYDTVFLSRRNNETAGAPPEQVAPEPQATPTQTVAPETTEQPPAQEPAAPSSTGEISGVEPTEPAPADTAPTEPAKEPEPKESDAPVPDVPEPAAPAAEPEGEAPQSEPAADPSPEAPAPAEQAPATDPVPVEPEASTDEPAAEPSADEPTDAAPADEPAAPPEPANEEPSEEEPVVDPDSVVEAGGTPDGETAPAESKPQGLTEDQIRAVMRDEISKALGSMNKPVEAVTSPEA